MTPAEAALERLCDPAHEVSAHYVIGDDGILWQLVRDEDRAWHAGAGAWDGQGDVNSRSIGIELVNDGQSAFPGLQMECLEALIAKLMERWHIYPDGVIGHSDMAPGRKQDPGPFFDWRRLAAKGLASKGGHDPGPSDPSFETFRKVAEYAGYNPDVSDQDLLTAVRLRWRPEATGPLCAEDYTPLGHCALWT